MSHSTATTPALAPSTIVAAWRGISWRMVRATFVLGCGLFVFHVGSGMAVGGGLRSSLAIFVADQIKAFGLLLAIAVADHITGNRPDRRGIYMAALLAGGALATVAAVSGASTIVSGVPFPPHVSFGLILYIYLDLVMIAGAALWVLGDRRRAVLARARMHHAELERVDAARRSVEADLQAMQARVDPRFLFDTLAEVRRLYESDAAIGEIMLDELIAYLRAAMPKVRAKSSTVGQEIELARSYLGIWLIHLGDRFTFRIEMPAEMADVPMPAMIVLPLVNQAIGRQRTDAQKGRTLAIRTSWSESMIEIEIEDTVASLAVREDDAIAAVRERLSALFGDDARLVLQTTVGGGSRALIEMPAVPRHTGQDSPMASALRSAG